MKIAKTLVVAGLIFAHSLGANFARADKSRFFPICVLALSVAGAAYGMWWSTEDWKRVDRENAAAAARFNADDSQTWVAEKEAKIATMEEEFKEIVAQDFQDEADLARLRALADDIRGETRGLWNEFYRLEVKRSPDDSIYELEKLSRATFALSTLDGQLTRLEELIERQSRMIERLNAEGKLSTASRLNATLLTLEDTYSSVFYKYTDDIFDFTQRIHGRREVRKAGMSVLNLKNFKDREAYAQRIVDRRQAEGYRPSSSFSIEASLDKTVQIKKAAGLFETAKEE